MAKGIAELLLERGAMAIGRAAGAVLSDPRGQEALARAVGLAQRGVQAFSEAQARALHAAGFAARPDYEELRKQVARLKRKARQLSQQLEGARPATGDADEASDGSGSGDDGPGDPGGSH